MPQYYITDNLQCWFRACVSERYEALVDDKEDVLDIKNALKCVEDFKNHCEHYLLMSGVGDLIGTPTRRLERTHSSVRL